MELLRQVLEDKEKEITDTKNQLRQAKKEAVREYPMPSLQNLENQLLKVSMMLFVRLRILIQT